MVVKEMSFFSISSSLSMLKMVVPLFSSRWYIYELTHNKLSLGILGLSEVIPAISLALYAGHVIDISDKRTLLFRNMFLYLVVVVCMGLIVTPQARQQLGTTPVEWTIYALIFMTGIFRAFTGPAFQSIVAQLVPREILTKAITFGSASWQMAAVIGPVLGGLFIRYIGLPLTFFIAVAFLCISIAMIGLIPKLAVAHNNLQQRTLESVKEGLRLYGKRRPC